jgi:hypothetical protein
MTSGIAKPSSYRDVNSITDDEARKIYDKVKASIARMVGNDEHGTIRKHLERCMDHELLVGDNIVITFNYSVGIDDLNQVLKLIRGAKQ